MSILWQKLSDFLHNANLIPLVIVASSYHYFQALNSHGPVLVAVTAALFLGLLHYRTVQGAVETQAASWWLMAAVTTSLTFGLQWIFYSQPGPDGLLPVWQRLLFAGIVPMGVGIMVWHHHHHHHYHQQQRQAERVVDWQQQLVQAQAEAKRAQAEAAVAQSRLVTEQRRAEAMQQQVEAAQQQAAAAQECAEAAQARASHLQKRVVAVQQRAGEMQKRAASERRRADELYVRAEDAQLAAVAAQARADEMRQRVADLETVAAVRAGGHESRMCRRGKRLNGQTAEVA